MKFYHVVNRGVDKRNITLDDSDGWRFMHSLYVFNDLQYVDPNHGRSNYMLSTNERELLVHIHAFCLMPNHYHLLLSPIKEHGVSIFMKKLNMGYAKFFNEKYNRSGALWQGKYRSVLVQQDAHFQYLPFYIHLNPLDLVFPTWRNGGLKNIHSALKYLNAYRWSSHLDYLGIKNIPSISSRDVLSEILGTPKTYHERIQKILRTDTDGFYNHSQYTDIFE